MLLAKHGKYTFLTKIIIIILKTLESDRCKQSRMHPHQNLTDALASVALVWIRP